MRRRRFVVGVIALVACLAAGSYGAQLASARAQDQITIGIVFPGAQFFPVNLADVKGYFKDEGLDVSVRNIPPAQLLPGLAGGSIQFGVFAAPQPELGAVAGAHIKYLAMWAPHPNIYFYSSPAITKGSQLRGKRIGYSVPGSTSAILTNYALHKFGLKTGDFSPAILGTNSALLAAWHSGQYDGGINAPPQLQIFLDARPGSHILYDFTKMTWINGALAANMDFVGAHPAVAVKVLRAINKGLQAWWQSPSDAEAVISQQTGVDAAAAEASYKSTLTIFTKTIQPVTVGLIKDEFYILRQNGFTDAKNSVAANVVDARYVYAVIGKPKPTKK